MIYLTTPWRKRSRRSAPQPTRHATRGSLGASVGRTPVYVQYATQYYLQVKHTENAIKCCFADVTLVISTAAAAGLLAQCGTGCANTSGFPGLSHPVPDCAARPAAAAVLTTRVTSAKHHYITFYVSFLLLIVLGSVHAVTSVPPTAALGCSRRAPAQPG